MERQTGSLIEPVEFVFVGGVRIQVRVAFLHDYMAGGAGAASSARVFDMNAEIDGHIQQGFGLAMFVVGKFSGLKFDSLPLRQKRYFGHNPIVACHPLSYWIFHVSSP